MRTSYLLFLFIMVVPGCGFMKPDNLKLITPQELKSVMAQQDILLIDVHVPEQKHIPGTDLFAPFYKVDKFANYLPTEKSAPIYLYCKSGPMGNWAARTLFDLGYTNVYNLQGGAEAWIESGLPVQ